MNILTKSGLERRQTGAVVFTVHDTPTEMQPEDISKMALPEFAKLYTVHLDDVIVCKDQQYFTLQVA